MLAKDKNNSGEDLENQLLDIVRELSYTVTDNSDKRYKNLRDIIMVIFNIALSSFYFGYSMVYLPSIDFSLIMKIYNIQVNQQLAQGLLVSTVAIGGGLGAAFASVLLEKFSRRNCLLIVNLAAIIFGLLLYVPNFMFFTVIRILQGVCVGVLSSVAPLIMKELSPNEISGMLTSCHQIFITFGATFGFVYSSFLAFMLNDQTGDKKWWIIFGFSLVILFVQSYFLLFKFNFQTPKYLLLNNKEEQARKLIERFYKPEHVQSVLKELKMNVNQNQQNNLVELTDRQNNLGINKIQDKKQPVQTPRNAMIVSLHLAVLQQFCGCNAIVPYGGQIVGQHAPSLKQAMPIIINMLQFSGAIIACFLLSRIGRKMLLQMGALTTCFASILVGVGFLNNSVTWIFIGLVIFMSCFGLTLGPVVWIYLPEVAQPKVLSLATAANWGSCALVILLFPIIKQMLPGKNPAGLFFFFAIWSIGSYIFNRKYLIQTKNKGQKQIFDEFSQMEQIF